MFPGFDGGAEWGGAAFDPDSALLYVNSNEMPWIVRLIPNNDTSLYNVNCATCHREDRKGSPAAPSLVGIGQRRSREEIATVIREGTGRMPAFPDMGGRNIADLVDFLLTGKDKGVDPKNLNDPSWLKYRIDGETLFRDPDGYPPITPPWGTLNAIDLNAGTIKWQIPFGEYPELAAKGLKDTGSDNYGGPIVTAGGVLFIGATNFDRKFHAYDKQYGQVVVGDDAAGGWQRDAIDLYDRRQAVRRHRLRRREERRAVGQRDRRLRASVTTKTRGQSRRPISKPGSACARGR